MLIYVAFRFKLISGAAAVIATVPTSYHSGPVLSHRREIDLTVIAALLTLIGYSMNDKIVVLDRVRENLTRHRRGSFLELINQSINQTLSRTILTAGLTLVACLALYFLGGRFSMDRVRAMCGDRCGHLFVDFRRECPVSHVARIPRTDMCAGRPNAPTAKAEVAYDLRIALWRGFAVEGTTAS